MGLIEQAVLHPQPLSPGISTLGVSKLNRLTLNPSVLPIRGGYPKPYDRPRRRIRGLHVEYGKRRIQCGILFIFGLVFEYIHLEYVLVPV